MHLPHKHAEHSLCGKITGGGRCSLGKTCPARFLASDVGTLVVTEPPVGISSLAGSGKGQPLWRDVANLGLP